MRGRALGYGVVLALVIASIAVQMTTTGSTGTRFVTIALQAATLVAAVRISGVRHAGVRLAALVAVAAVVASLVTWAIRGGIPIADAAIVNGLLVAVAPVAIAAGMVRDLRETHEVTVSTLSGVLAIYLLVGMFFSFLYGVVGETNAEALFAEQAGSDRSDQLYFSFVTMCTVGYGDLTPVGDAARTLAVAEMLFGQIYLVTVVALIVSQLSGRRQRS